MTDSEFQELVKKFGARQAELIRGFDEGAQARQVQTQKLKTRFGSSATAPPPAAVGASPNFGTTPPAAFSQPAAAQDGKLLKEVLEGVQEILELLKAEPPKPGFDKDDRFTPGGPKMEREAPTGRRRQGDGFMQSALQAFVHNLRTH